MKVPALVPVKLKRIIYVHKESSSEATIQTYDHRGRDWIRSAPPLSIDAERPSASA